MILTRTRTIVPNLHDPQDSYIISCVKQSKYFCRSSPPWVHAPLSILHQCWRSSKLRCRKIGHAYLGLTAHHDDIVKRLTDEFLNFRSGQAMTYVLARFVHAR